MIDIQHEYFDIVDVHDHLIGVTKQRSEVHRDLNDWHRITAVWTVNDGGEVLCQQRSFAKDVHPGMWTLTFGGHVRAGETYDENVVGELYEELGLQVVISDLIRLGHHINEEHRSHL